MYIPDFALIVLKKLNDSGYESFLIGGCVRDYLMGVEPKDYDVTTNASIEEIEAVFSDFKVIETGAQHGTVTVISDGNHVEVTTYRIDGTYSDGRHPDSVIFSSNIRDDLSRRDFTVNSMAYSPRDGFVDAFDGRRDINNKIIRCVGNPDKRFEEDALRILRALRFSSTLEFSIEEETSRSIHKNKHLLGRLAKERITSEFFQLVCGKNAAAVLREYSDIATEIIPTLSDMYGFPQDNPYHIYDVWEHTLRVIENAPPTAKMRMAALLHDIGKPHCKTFDEKWVGHFYGHADISAEISRDIFIKYLRTDRHTADEIINLVKNHGENFTPSRKIIRRRLVKYGEKTARQILDLSRADIMGMSPKYSCRLAELDRAEEILDGIISEQSCLSVKNLAVNGRDLMAVGIENGKIMGNILNKLLNEVCDETLINEKEALTKRAIELYKVALSK